MFDPFGANPHQFESARWHETDREHCKLIRVEIVTENERRWSSLIQSLVTSEGTTVLKTDYAYAYQPDQHIFYRNKWWLITAVGEKDLELNPQAMALVSPVFNRQTILEVMEVDEWILPQ